MYILLSGPASRLLEVCIPDNASRVVGVRDTKSPRSGALIDTSFPGLAQKQLCRQPWGRRHVRYRNEYLFGGWWNIVRIVVIRPVIFIVI